MFKYKGTADIYTYIFIYREREERPRGGSLSFLSISEYFPELYNNKFEFVFLGVQAIYYLGG